MNKNTSLNSGYMVASVDPWQEYRKRRNLAQVAFFGYMLIVFLIGMVTVHLFHTDTQFYVAAFSWMVFYAKVSRSNSRRAGRCTGDSQTPRACGWITTTGARALMRSCSPEARPTPCQPSLESPMPSKT